MGKHSVADGWADGSADGLADSSLDGAGGMEESIEDVWQRQSPRLLHIHHHRHCLPIQTVCVDGFHKSLWFFMPSENTDFNSVYISLKLDVIHFSQSLTLLSLKL